MPTILISGAAAGLGLAFLETYGKESSNTIIAIDKDAPPKHFTDGTHKGARIVYHAVNVTSKASIHNLTSTIRDTPIDLVLHSAGIRGLVPAVENAHPEDVAACETLEVMDLDTMVRTFSINALGTFLLLRALLPNLRLAPNPKVVIMSSRMGSVGHNTTGSAYAYRASKAALNSIVKSMSIDIPEVAFILCHPGRVETKLVRCKEEGAISAEESVAGLLPLISKWDRNDTGKFYDRFGEPIVW